MKWFQHDCDAINDIKIRKLIRKFGMAGYGVYFATLELIGQKMEHDVENFGFLPDEYNEEELGILFGLSSDNIRTMYEYMVEIGLFEQKEKRIYNKKIKGRCDNYTYRLIRHKTITPNSVRTVSEQSRPRVEEKRVEEKRVEEKRVEENARDDFFKKKSHDDENDDERGSPEILSALKKMKHNLTEKLIISNVQAKNQQDSRSP